MNQVTMTLYGLHQLNVHIQSKTYLLLFKINNLTITITGIIIYIHYFYLVELNLSHMYLISLTPLIMSIHDSHFHNLCTDTTMFSSSL